MFVVNIRLRILVVLSLLVWSTPWLSLHAQPVINGHNSALGGGGVAYLGGVEATFFNPANLAIPDRPGNFHIGIGQLGVFYEPVLSSTSLEQQAIRFTNQFLPYTPGDAELSGEQRSMLLSRHFDRQSLVSQRRSRTDLLLGGLLFQRGESAFSIAARARLASRIKTGRGWYDDEAIVAGGQQVRDFSLLQQRNQLYEISFGFAREFTFINGLSSSLNRLYIGIAPKIVFSGPRFEANYQAQYLQDENVPPVYRTEFSYYSSGSYTSLTHAYRSTADPQASIDTELNRYTLKPTGLGLGVDFGLTYLIPLDNRILDLEKVRDAGVGRSLRFSFSFNDLGLVQERRQPLHLSSPVQTYTAAEQPPLSSWFMGAGGQYLSILNEAEALSNPLTNAERVERQNYLSLLPTSFNAGLLLDLQSLKFMGDLNFGLHNTAFTTTALAVNMGIEVRPLPWVPLRVGTRITSNEPPRLGLGTGFETRYWDFTLGTQIYFRSQALTTNVVGGGFAGIQLHL